MLNTKKTKKKMGKSNILIAFMFLFLSLTFISAQALEGNRFYVENGLSLGIKEPGSLKAGQNYTFSTHVYNSTDSIGTPLAIGQAYCAFHLYSPNNGNHLIANNNISFGSTTYDYFIVINGENISEPGVYPYVLACIGNSNVGSAVYSSQLIVTPNGSLPGLPNMLLLTLILSSLFILTGFSIYGINNAREGAWQIFYVCLTYVLVFSVLFLLWITSKNYLYDVPILEDVFWIVWIILGALFLPFIIGISSYILKKEAEAMLEADLVKQGYTSEDAREMARKHK